MHVSRKVTAIEFGKFRDA